MAGGLEDSALPRLPPRILLATVLGKFAEPHLLHSFKDAAVHSVGSPQGLQAVLTSRLQFDVLVADLCWPGYAFDGLDVLKLVRDNERWVQVILVASGTPGERDYIDEAADSHRVAGTYHVGLGPDALVRAVRTTLAGGKLTEPDVTAHVGAPGNTRIDHFLRRRKSASLAKVLGVIASGRAADYRAIANITGIPEDTVNKTPAALQQLLVARGELAPGAVTNAGVLYRWCGLHADYLLSWCRRNEVALHALGPVRVAARNSRMHLPGARSCRFWEADSNK
jgi:DNA-binding NarL/FixJ family response regulator